ncbi:MAG: hypothetical protein DMH00_04495 [Acidobacteria bacterium]|nr:MAG: hypothetical protein DMH00_04495 [Acidobacteriota bacterium]
MIERRKKKDECAVRGSRLRGSFGGSKRFLTSVIVFAALVIRGRRREPVFLSRFPLPARLDPID